MLDDRAVFEEVRAVIERETELIVELNSILRQETEVLQSPDAAGLARVLEQKVSPLAAINESKATRYSILRTVNYAESEDGWVSLVNDLDQIESDHSITLANLLQILRGELMQSRTLNRVNAEIINRSMFSVHHLLNILRGNVPENNLYGESGEPVNVGTKPSITSA
ncbi:MAG: flagella synthesis protein FlgN [Pseudomonadales bacterium]